MQIAGNKCKVCERNIILSNEGKGCARCGAVVHRTGEWAWTTLGNRDWQKHGVTVIREQNVCRDPGNRSNSHQASD
jgi:hypothetical protein